MLEAGPCTGHLSTKHTGEKIRFNSLGLISYGRSYISNGVNKQSRLTSVTADTCLIWYAAPALESVFDFLPFRLLHVQGARAKKS